MMKLPLPPDTQTPLPPDTQTPFPPDKTCFEQARMSQQSEAAELVLCIISSSHPMVSSKAICAV